jgi:polysaccharide chain length determinant protein (PEP-CTERM system associated)
MEPGQMHVLDYVAVVRRRRWWLVAPIALSVVVGILLARFLPKEYRSSVTLGVAAPIVSPNLVSQSTSLNTDDRLRAISQQLLSLPILDRVVKDESQKRGSDDLQIGDLQRSIEIAVPETVTGASGSGQKRLDNFVVSYSDEDPVRAQRVANRLATVFVDENSKSRTERAEDTSAFIATQLRTSQARLADLEARLRQSKEAHMGQLPEQTQANLQMLAGLRQQLEANATTLRGEQDRLTMIERQIEAYKQDADASSAAKGNAGTPESRIAALQQELTAARSTYTAKHPEVIRLETDLAAAKKDLEAERNRPLNEVAARATDPALRQLLQDRDATRLRVAEIQRSGNDTQRQIGLYQSRVEAAPMVEQQLATVQRDYDLEKQQYSDLSAKLHSATIAESVERNRSGEQFTILYPASYPLTPTKPVIWRLMVMAIAGGLVAGATLAFLREYLDRSVHDARALKSEFDLPILGEIAHIKA